MAVEVALAMLERNGRWLVQLRDEIPTIVAPGCWGLSGGHLDPGETAQQTLRREFLEEISWQPQTLELAMVHHIHRRTAHMVQAELSVPLEQLPTAPSEKRIRALARTTEHNLTHGSSKGSAADSGRCFLEGLEKSGCGINELVLH
jgi:8-oxo-dGTP diphosphatase